MLDWELLHCITGIFLFLRQRRFRDIGTSHYLLRRSILPTLARYLTSLSYVNVAQYAIAIDFDRRVYDSTYPSCRYIGLYDCFTVMPENLIILTGRYTVATTTVWSGLSYVYSKDAVKILKRDDN
jgi:hypothetical protein